MRNNGRCSNIRGRDGRRTWGAGTRELGCVLAGLATVVALGACGGGSGSGNGVAAKSPNAIVNAAIGAISSAKSIHIAGTVTQTGTPMTFDLETTSQGVRGEVTLDRIPVKVIYVGSSLYLYGGAAFWSRLTGSSSVAGQLDNKWLRLPASSGPGLSSFTRLLNPRNLLNTCCASGRGSLTKGTTGRVNGKSVVAVHDATDNATLYVATTGKPYPVEIVPTKGVTGGHIAFYPSNMPVTLAAPAGAVDATQLNQ